MEPSVPASAGRPIAAVPISEHPPLSEELSAPSTAYVEATAVARAETSRRRPFFGRDPEKVTRVHRTNPDYPPMVLDFLVGNLPREACDVSHYVNRALRNLPRSWVIDLDEMVTMAAQVTRDYEERPSTACLQADLEAAQKRNVELADKLATLEKNSAEAVKEVERMKAELVEARRPGEVSLKEAAGRQSCTGD
ncbi:hypothetical protein OROMI_018396 [Orobanche minor]